MPSPIHQRFSRLAYLGALSRTPHGILDMCTPAFAVLLWLGGFPSPGVTIVGLITVFAGYTAVYALNDLVDYRHDREKLRQSGLVCRQGDLDAVMLRHPLAQGCLSWSEALLWTGGWTAVAIAGAWWLNPVCVFIFALGCLLETLYCLLLRVSHYRALLNGVVKTLGPVAAVFAVDPTPGDLYVVGLFLFLFLWELGGQNIPNDWADRDEDHRLSARTIPVELGPVRSGWLIGLTLLAAVAINALLFRAGQLPYVPLTVLAAVTAGIVLLWVPAIRLLRRPAAALAQRLFNRASFYPPVLLIIVLLQILLQALIN